MRLLINQSRLFAVRDDRGNELGTAQRLVEEVALDEHRGVEFAQDKILPFVFDTDDADLKVKGFGLFDDAFEGRALLRVDLNAVDELTRELDFVETVLLEFLHADVFAGVMVADKDGARA